METAEKKGTAGRGVRPRTPKTPTHPLPWRRAGRRTACLRTTLFQLEKKINITRAGLTNKAKRFNSSVLFFFFLMPDVGANQFQPRQSPYSSREQPHVPPPRQHTAPLAWRLHSSMYSARSLLRPQLSVIYTYPARHLVLFQPADRQGMWCLQGRLLRAPSPVLQTAGPGAEHGSLQIFPKNNMIRGGITPKKAQALCLQSTPVRGCHAEHHTVIQTPNRVHSPGFGMG